MVRVLLLKILYHIKMYYITVCSECIIIVYDYE